MTTILAADNIVKRISASKKGLALIDKKYKRGMPGTAPSLSVASEPLCWVVDFGRDSNSIGPASSGTPTSATPRIHRNERRGVYLPDDCKHHFYDKVHPRL